MGLSCTEYFNCMAGQNKSFFSPLFAFFSHSLTRSLQCTDIIWKLNQKIFIFAFIIYINMFFCSCMLKSFFISFLLSHLCVDSISDYNRLKERNFYWAVTHAQHTKCMHVSRGGFFFSLFKLNWSFCWYFFFYFFFSFNLSWIGIYAKMTRLLRVA